MSLPATHNLTIYQGDTFRRTLQITVDGQPLDLTGATVRAHIRRTWSEPTATEMGMEITSATGGTVFMTLAGEATAALKGNSVWDLEITHPGGEVQTLVRGAVLLGREVSR